jgi:hypothetical protein
VLVDEGLEPGQVLQGLDHARDQGHAGCDGELAALGLGAHQPDGVGGGPTQVRPAASTRSAKPAFSARKP